MPLLFALIRYFTAKMMLEWLEEVASAATLEDAVMEVIAEGKAKTYDMGGSDTSLQVAEAVAAKL